MTTERTLNILNPPEARTTQRQRHETCTLEKQKYFISQSAKLRHTAHTKRPPYSNGLGCCRMLTQLTELEVCVYLY
jgi:hypothetical protein